MWCLIIKCIYKLKEKYSIEILCSNRDSRNCGVNICGAEYDYCVVDGSYVGVQMVHVMLINVSKSSWECWIKWMSNFKHEQRVGSKSGANE